MKRESDPEALASTDSSNLVLVMFTLEGRRFAVPLDSVVRVERIATITPLPQAPQIITGIVDFHGEIIPVADVRCRFGIPSRPVELSDQILFLKTRRRSIAFLVEDVESVENAPTRLFIDVERVVAGLEHIRGILRLEDGMVLIYDPETFLSLDEERTLEDALREGSPCMTGSAVS